jgi:hypothetical protein
MVFLFSVAYLNAQDLNAFFTKTNLFVSEHVKNGKVAYTAIHKDQTNLNTLLNIAEGISVQGSDSNNYKTFWINAYNIAVIKEVIDNYPTTPPLDITSFFDKTTYN